MRILNEIIGKELGKNPHKTTALSGGDINKVYHCIYEEKELVIKFNIANKYPKMFEKESKGLRLLSATNFKTPKTIATGNFKNHNYLILEYIQPGNKLNWIKFGENLALMHQITNQKFGFGGKCSGNYCALTLTSRKSNSILSNFRVILIL